MNTSSVDSMVAEFQKVERNRDKRAEMASSGQLARALRVTHPKADEDVIQACVERVLHDDEDVSF